MDEKIRARGEAIFAQLENDPVSIFNKDWWYGQIMEWSMKNEHFKTQMFRFVDVLPSLNSSQDVAKHLKEYFAESGEELPSVFNFGLGLSSLAPGLLAGAVKKNVTQMAKMFITGETPQDAMPLLKKARSQNLAFTVDLLGEATLSEKEALDYQSRYIDLVNWLSKDAENWETMPQIDTDENGPLPKVNVSVKMTSVYSQASEVSFDESAKILKERLRPIFTLAKERFVFINIDMEQYAYKNLTLKVFKDLISEPEFKSYPHFGIVIQAYLRDSLQDIDGLAQFAKARGTPFTIRLVKGAYWDYETIHAQQMGWPIPVYLNKKESDWNYERCTKRILESYPNLKLAMGSHNVRSIAAGLEQAEALKIPQKAVEVQMLFGMADPIKRAIVKQGVRVREYTTVGELIPGMAYLVRRLLENTSNESFLKSKFADNISTGELLKNPEENLQKTDPHVRVSQDKFFNEPNLDFAIPENREKLRMALEKMKKTIGQVYPIVIGKKDIKTNRFIERVNPSHPSELVGKVAIATITEAEQAVVEAKRALPEWKNLAPEKRADFLEELADLILRDRFELISLEILEVGKPWEEADGDITEAVDFCRYYAREMRKLAKPQRVGHAPGEVSHYHYQPKGVALVIAPWNFPLAILTGMTAAALVTGNTVIMKPAEQSSVIAAYLMKLIKEAGFPAGVVSYLPGLGEEIGEFLTGHRDVDLIAFTGSKAVGLHIIEKTSRTQPTQRGVKKCIIEMGGKNAVIIDNDADLDEAVAGVIYSAFGFQGQKCSACSRAIVLESVYDRFTERLIEAARSIHVRYAEDPGAFMGPVVDKEAQLKILSMVEQAKSECKLGFQGAVPAEGFFVPPTIFTDVAPNAKIAQDEIFGPVLAVIKVKDMDEALKVANSVEYGLTGGLFSRSPANIERVKRDFDVGNLYINRGITGAMVDRHPFGGFKMSGVGSKTGGPDYLLQFMDPRTVTENTLRRGFAPVE